MFTVYAANAAVLVGMGLLAGAAVTDATRMRIPNALSVGLAIAAFVWQMAAGGALLQALGLATLIFALGAFAFSRGWMAGGDVKLLVAVILFTNFTSFLGVLLTIAIAGGLVTLVWTLGAPWRRALAGTVLPLDVALSRSVPYGIAIAAGGGLHLTGILKLSI